MPTEAITAMAMARSNFGYISEARDETQLMALKSSSVSFNLALKTAGMITRDELTCLTEELESVCLSWHSVRR